MTTLGYGIQTDLIFNRAVGFVEENDIWPCPKFCVNLKK